MLYSCYWHAGSYYHYFSYIDGYCGLQLMRCAVNGGNLAVSLLHDRTKLRVEAMGKDVDRNSAAAAPRADDVFHDGCRAGSPQLQVGPDVLGSVVVHFNRPHLVGADPTVEHLQRHGAGLREAELYGRERLCAAPCL